MDINIKAPIERVFHITANWHQFPELRMHAAVQDYHTIHSDSGKEYFWLKVKDMPFKSSYCYGKRLLREPDMIVNIFTYKVFRKNSLLDPERLEEMIQKEWESFFYQTTRLKKLTESWTKIRVTEPDESNEEELRNLKTFYQKIKKIAESEIVPLGITDVAEMVNDEDYIFDEGFFDSEGFAPQQVDDEFDPYTILGLQNRASNMEIKQAYRNLARKWHPDKMAEKSIAMKQYGHNQFIEITAAYHSILRMRNI